MKKPNIVYICADEMRADSLHHLGNPAAITPNLDRLAEEGVSFRHAYCQNPVCVPSRCCFLTGHYSHTMGHRTIHYQQNEFEPNILKTMKKQGYEVIWAGKNHVVPLADLSEYCDVRIKEPRKIAFLPDSPEARRRSDPDISTVDLTDPYYYSYYMGLNDDYPAQQRDEYAITETIRYLRQRQKSNPQKPFFLYLCLIFPHPPYGVSSQYYGKTDRSKLPPRIPNVDNFTGKPSMLYGIWEKENMQSWNEEQWSELRGTYLDMVNAVDDWVGQLKDVLVETGEDDNTNIFFFADHGDYTGDFGIVEKTQNTFDDPVCNVPLIFRPAKDIKVTPRISEALVELTDLSATIIELSGNQFDYTQFGKSLTHLLDKEEEHREFVTCEGGRIHGETQAMENIHTITFQGYPRLGTQCEEGPQHTKAYMMRFRDFKYVKRLYEDDELYDLINDPQETVNLIHEEKYRQLISDCERRLLYFLIETGDYVPNRLDRDYA